MKSPIIIGSAPSTGSTLLRVLLGRHPSIACGGEVALLDKRALLAEPVDAYRSSIASWFDKGYPANFLGPSEELFEELDEYPWTRDELRSMCLTTPTYIDMLETFYARHVEHVRAERWLDKCPSNIYCFDLIARQYPSARFIHIVRDARDCVASYFRRTGSSFCSVSRWYYATLSGIQYRSWHNYLEVKYEDLVKDTVGALHRICEFIDEPYDDCMLNPDDESGQPRHSSWRYSAKGGVVANHAKQPAQLTPRQQSMFKHVSLSPYGRSLLFTGNNTINEMSPIALQAMLGYDASELSEATPLKDHALNRSWLEFQDYKTKISARYGVDIECEVALS